MGQKSILLTIGVIIFAVLFVVLLILSRLESPTNKKTAQKAVVTPKNTINTVDIINDPLVYDGLTVEVDSKISDWITKRSFTVSTGKGLLGGSGQLLVISKSSFTLPQNAPKNGIGLGETVNVHLKGRVRIMDRVELGRALGLDLDGKDIKLDDNSIDSWKEGSVLLLTSVEKL